MLRTFGFAAALTASSLVAISPSHAGPEAALLIEADSGKVLYAENATVPWYPASLSKLMTTYVTLQAVKNKRITLDTLLTVSARAASQAPSKIGFRPGTQVTVDNALKILLVKSANDMAVVLAEGVGGSVEQFADEMNQTSARLGMTQSSWVNPNGLPADQQISSARDLGILARSLMRDFPEYDMYWHIPAIQLGKRVMRNYNRLIGRYDGADGMNTGFICASGFNLVASATRNHKRLIAVVLGAPSSAYRSVKAASLLERGFHRGPLSWLAPSLGTVEALKVANVNATPPDLRDEMCGPHRKRPAAEDADEEIGSEMSLLSSLPPGAAKPSTLLKEHPDPVRAIKVFAGAAKKAAETQFAAARAKLNKLVKGKNGSADVAAAAATATDPMQRDPHTAPLPKAGGAPPLMSFAPTAKGGPAPLTAMPGAKPDPMVVSVPLPRARPRIAVAKQTITKRTSAKH
jgi:D-alanyl-D-alanine carboxypeptidase